MPRPFEVPVRKPSDLHDLGDAITMLGANDGDAMRTHAVKLVIQIEHVLRQRGVPDPEITEISKAATKHLSEAAATLEALIPIGEAVGRLGDTVIYALRAQQAKPVVVGGFSITGQTG